MSDLNLKYLKMLALQYPNVASASAEMIKLQAMMELPKGTEHFISDIHGEHEAFFHVIKNASGAIKRKIDDALGDGVDEEDKKELATIIYYPKEKLELIRRVGGLSNEEYETIIKRMLLVCGKAISKYPRLTIYESLPERFVDIFAELLGADFDHPDKGAYYSAIINNIISDGRADDFIITLAQLISRMAISRLHIVGDIYDRGPGPHLIMDFLEKYHAFDVQWGNHDVVWMGSALGHGPCICNVLRASLRYDGLDIVENGYGINMDPLRELAKKYYADDPCECYAIKGQEITFDTQTQLTMKMHKAISVIQWKLEGALVKANPEFGMGDRAILERIDQEKGTVVVDGREIPLKDPLYPTVDPNAPYELNPDEQEVIDTLSIGFRNCWRLRKHADLLVKHGGLYKAYNGNLMYHACVPLNEDGSLMEVPVFGKLYKGKTLYDELEKYVRKAFNSDDEKDRETGADILWFLWCGPGSPLFGKAKMATFERYLLDDKESHKEIMNSYYKLLDSEDTAKMILKEFGLDPDKGVIVNGHVPVKHSKGENPIKAGGKIFMIDGGLSKAYQKETGIAGYTLVYNSMGKILSAHMPFTSAMDAVKNGVDIVSEEVAKETEQERILLKDTNEGMQLKEKTEDLKELIEAYRSGIISEKC